MMYFCDVKISVIVLIVYDVFSWTLRVLVVKIS